MWASKLFYNEKILGSISDADKMPISLMKGKWVGGLGQETKAKAFNKAQLAPSESKFLYLFKKTLMILMHKFIPCFLVDFTNSSSFSSQMVVDFTNSFSFDLIIPTFNRSLFFIFRIFQLHFMYFCFFFGAHLNLKLLSYLSSSCRYHPLSK